MPAGPWNRNRRLQGGTISLEEEYFNRNATPITRIRKAMSDIWDYISDLLGRLWRWWDWGWFLITILISLCGLLLYAAVSSTSSKLATIEKMGDKDFGGQWLVVSNVTGDKIGYRAHSIQEGSDKVDIELVNGSKLFIKGSYIAINMEKKNYKKWLETEKELGLERVLGQPKELEPPVEKP